MAYFEIEKAKQATTWMEGLVVHTDSNSSNTYVPKELLVGVLKEMHSRREALKDWNKEEQELARYEELFGGAIEVHLETPLRVGVTDGILHMDEHYVAFLECTNNGGGPTHICYKADYVEKFGRIEEGELQ